MTMSESLWNVVWENLKHRPIKDGEDHCRGLFWADNVTNDLSPIWSFLFIVGKKRTLDASGDDWCAEMVCAAAATVENSTDYNRASLLQRATG